MELCEEPCIKILKLNRDHLTDLNRGRLSYTIFYHLYKIYGKVFLTAYKNLNEKRAAKIIIIDPFRNRSYAIYTYLGSHAEYIIIPDAPYCGCFSRYPAAIVKRQICPHLIGFCLECILGRIKKIYIEDTFNNVASTLYDSMFR